VLDRRPAFPGWPPTTTTHSFNLFRVDDSISLRQTSNPSALQSTASIHFQLSHITRTRGNSKHRSSATSNKTQKKTVSGRLIVSTKKRAPSGARDRWSKTSTVAVPSPFCESPVKHLLRICADDVLAFEKCCPRSFTSHRDNQFSYSSNYNFALFKAWQISTRPLQPTTSFTPTKNSGRLDPQHDHPSTNHHTCL
jgi:hypothetical protein